MDDLLKIDTVKDYDRYWDMPTRHPLVGVIEGERVGHLVPHWRKVFGIYVVFLKDLPCADHLKYGRREYDFQAKTLVFVSPGQVLGNPHDGSAYEPHGWCLYFSPELLHGTPLGRHIRDYTFFSYDVSEALHISDDERATIVSCLQGIDREIDASDRHSRQIIASQIELLLNYCTRFYDRQFRTRQREDHDVLTRFESLLDDYLSSQLPRRLGTPTVAWCAEQVHLSPNYFGDLIKKETGRSALDHIQRKLADTAKRLLAAPGQSVSEVAYALGYQYPQYFNRAFKRRVGCTPMEYRQGLAGKR